MPENDSPGEFIFLVAEIYRYTHDRILIEAMWPHVDAAIQYVDRLRQSERNDANLASGTRAFYGLLPASISHEGYSEKPMHSYWDDFWALKGYDDALSIATALGHTDAAARLSAQR
ncbi:MAG: discoidin domain-containing protein, partial [Betaproteobacteria bacterium]